MKIFVFDIDNTLILHTNKNVDFYKKSDSKISTLISNTGVDKVYIYTNGTYGHGEKVKESLNIKTEKVFGRDTIPYMKPYIQSFNFVNGDIINKNGKNNDIYFFDDMVENLLTAERIGWKTVWISPDFMQKQRFINYSFPNIYEALNFFKIK
jgi:FMN phosphatase YigB (HAD superfamily)